MTNSTETHCTICGDELENALAFDTGVCEPCSDVGPDRDDWSWHPNYRIEEVNVCPNGNGPHLAELGPGVRCLHPTCGDS